MNLQPLNIYMSYQGTLNLIEKISEDHDVEVLVWPNEGPLIAKGKEIT